MDELLLNAYAKINLSLDVLKRREDGYHDLRMVMQTIDVSDEIRLEKTNADGVFELSTNKPSLPCDEKNLMVKAAKLMWEKYHLPGGLRMHLTKNIPMAAGLAGGSTDAAAVFNGINRMYDCNASVSELQSLGVTIGADIPYCIVGGTYLAEGIGEMLTPLEELPEVPLVLIKPDFDVSTGYVYTHLTLDESTNHPIIEEQIRAIGASDMPKMASYMGNVLESVTVLRYPEIDRIKKDLTDLHSFGAMMSGSGPSVFGLFENAKMAKEAAGILRGKYPKAEVFVTSFIQPK